MAPSTSFEPFQIGERVISSQTELEVFLTTTNPEPLPPPPPCCVKHMTNELAAANPKVQGTPTRPPDNSHAPHMRARSRKAATSTKPTKPFLPHVTHKCNSRKTERQRERRAGATHLRDRITEYTKCEDKWLEEAFRGYARAHDGKKIPRAALVTAHNKRFPDAKRTASGISNHIFHDEDLKAKIAEAIQGSKTTQAKRRGLRSSRRA